MQPEETMMSTFKLRESNTEPVLRGACDIMEERNRQITKEGWNAVHDDRYQARELTKAAICYLWGNNKDWPWPRHWFKPTDLRRNLVKAGALIAAEIDRLDRETARIDAACGDNP
jgi:hypothetical protein